MVLIIAILALLHTSLATTPLVYEPPISSLKETNTTDTPLLLEPTHNTNASLVSGSTNETTLDSLLQWQNTTNNTSLNNTISYSCHREFGVNLRAESCIDAIEQLGLNDDTPHTYGLRNSGHEWDYNVPQRFISRKPIFNTILRNIRSHNGLGLIHEL